MSESRVANGVNGWKTVLGDRFWFGWKLVQMKYLFVHSVSV